MREFVQLFTRLDQTTKTTRKVELLVDYFGQANDQDRLWAIAILSGRRPKRSVKSSLLRQWAASLAGIPDWLMDDSYHVVGDLAETIALVLRPPVRTQNRSLTEWINTVKGLALLTDEEKQEVILSAWESMTTAERFVFNKLITGSFRVGVSQKLIIKAIARFEEQEENAIAHRLMGNWTPDTTDYENLIRSSNPADDDSRPYPFYLAYALEAEPATLGSPDLWQIERKWDGIRGQVIVREGEVYVWSRGEELVTAKFPEFHPLASLLPDGTVIDGEILPFKDEKPLSFNVLQTRIGRKNVTKKIRESAPVILMCYDLLEYNGEDIRARPLGERRALLEQLVAGVTEPGILYLSEVLEINDWSEAVDARAQSRENLSEGLMVKRMDSAYRSGRKKGDWWKWKIDPLTVDAVMIYAQQGHGRRANLFTDYTFAVWKGEELVPFTKAYSGLTDKEFKEITSWVKRNTRERFGPVRSVKPEQVFEIAFEGINASSRHKSGIALRFPRMLRWRKDKPAGEANTLADLQQMLIQYG
ncbi:ATP-dependent DNA ligase [Neolewinella aurantiaca]|uniref:DNA ligase (ATP) n=1 Tax=Neolewinella aurantiaca TaxID=2602767 RepID=A0A5C7FZM7_9BACT|nr:ATP-dependent DNA ligase [Neolewinella aurantiaca]TXF91156.1 ATP-dependent DNA ligase [Neolewinella aurantiaca]